MNSKAVLLGASAGVIALFGFQAYDMHSTKSMLQSRLDGLESKVQAVQDSDVSRISELTTSLNMANERIGSTSQDILKQTERATAALKKEQSKTVADLHSQLANQSEEHAKVVSALRAENAARLEEMKQEANSQFGAVSGDVKNVNGQVDLVKSDLASTKEQLAANRREIGDVRDSLGRQIAHNQDELSILKRRGERNYYEFSIPKSNTMQRVGDIQLQLTKADTKAQRYDVSLLVADAKLAKKGQIINEPVPLLVGKNHLRYELVVNSVEKDRIRGYVSAPKDGSLNIEGPTAN